jgi:hypothetical protein
MPRAGESETVDIQNGRAAHSCNLRTRVDDGIIVLLPSS